MKKIITILLTSLMLSGCAEIAMDNNLYEYKKVQQSISLGDSKNKVLGTLIPIMQDLPEHWKRTAGQYLVNDDRYYVHYHRTSWVQDGAVTDDEFTPYVFKNDKLVAIGWQSLGGPKSFGNAAAASANQRAQSEALLQIGKDMRKTPSTTSSSSGMRYPLSSSYVSGMNRVCIYKLGGMVKTKTMNGISLCPMSY